MAAHTYLVGDLDLLSGLDELAQRLLHSRLQRVVQALVARGTQNSKKDCERGKLFLLCLAVSLSHCGVRVWVCLCVFFCVSLLLSAFIDLSASNPLPLSVSLSLNVFQSQEGSLASSDLVLTSTSSAFWGHLFMSTHC